MDISSISGMSETSINFTNSQESGHKHDGIVSALIDTSKYSVFDFSPSLIDISDPNRRNIQQSNLDSLRTFVVNVINGSTISPEQINIKANTITSTQIAAGTITSTEISSDFILVNNQISSNNYTSGSSGWLISSNGFAEFSDVTIRGTVVSNTGTIGGWTIASNGFSSSTSYYFAPLLSNILGYISLEPAIDANNSGVITVGLDYTGLDTNSYKDKNTIGGQRIISSREVIGAITTQKLSAVVENYNLSVLDETYYTSNSAGISSKITIIDPYDAVFSGNISADANCIIYGSASISNFANISGTTNIGGNLNVNGSASTTSISGNLNVTGTSSVTTVKLLQVENAEDIQPGQASVRITRSFNIGTLDRFIVFINEDSAAAIGSIEFANAAGVKYNTTSDERLKIKINDSSSMLELVDAIEPTWFKWKDIDDDDLHYGVFAQQLYQVYPDAVSVGVDDGDEPSPWQVDYSKLVPALIGAVKELKQKVDKYEQNFHTNT